jgi:transcriptional regulator with XRE-family HTH domain
LPERGSPSVRRRQLAAELRRLRERAGKTGDQAARELGWWPSKVSRIESSRAGVTSSDLQQLSDLYGADEAGRSLLQALARESAKTGWIDATATAGFPADYTAFIYAEAEASAAWDWEPQVMAGLLQTESYARETMTGWHSMFRLPPTDLEAMVAARMLRQQNFLDREQPLELKVILDESVLGRRFGDAAIMREQLLHVADLAELPQADIRVLPLNGIHPIGTGSFVYMQFAKVNGKALPDIVFVEQLVSNSYTEGPAATNQFRVTFEQLLAEALDATRSRDLIVQAARDLWA